MELSTDAIDVPASSRNPMRLLIKQEKVSRRADRRLEKKTGNPSADNNFLDAVEDLQVLFIINLIVYYCHNIIHCSEYS